MPILALCTRDIMAKTDLISALIEFSVWHVKLIINHHTTVGSAKMRYPWHPKDVQWYLSHAWGSEKVSLMMWWPSQELNGKQKSRKSQVGIGELLEKQTACIKFLGLRQYSFGEKLRKPVWLDYWQEIQKSVTWDCETGEQAGRSRAKRNLLGYTGGATEVTEVFLSVVWYNQICVFKTSLWQHRNRSRGEASLGLGAQGRVWRENRSWNGPRGGVQELNTGNQKEPRALSCPHTSSDVKMRLSETPLAGSGLALCEQGKPRVTGLGPAVVS